MSTRSDTTITFRYDVSPADAETMRKIRDSGGLLVYAETSGRPQFEPTRLFYERLGVFREAHLKDFYAPGTTRCFGSKAFDAQRQPSPLP